MKRLVISAPLFALLAACAQASDEPPPPVPTSTGIELASAEIPTSPPAPSAEPQPGDLAPCPGINPDIRRPAGSNCLGITPDQCGANEATLYVGVRGTPNIREQLSTIAKGRFRWIPHMTAVTDDLDPTRMNVSLDEGGVIVKIDCY